MNNYGLYLFQMLRQTSRTDTVGSCQSGSIRTFLISEASSVLPCFSVSAFSLDINNDFGSTQSASRPDLFGQVNRFDEGLSSSCKEGLDVFDNPDYTDTVKSTDSSGSILRRSMSVPPQYTYKGQVRKHAREVFEDFIVKEEPRKIAGQDQDEEDDENKPWRQTMEDLLERSDYIDSLQSTSSGTALLARTATSISKAGLKETKLVEEEREAELKKQKDLCHMYIKNLIVLSVTCFFCFGAYLSLRNLQSSINADTGLAFYSLSLLYLFFFIGCIFATTIIQYLRPKRTMIIGQVIILMYVGTNFYPTYYTLLPASVVVGFTLATFWTAHSTYLASIGINYSQLVAKNPVAVLTKFNGIFFTFFGISQVLGNVISSTVFMVQMRNDNNNKLMKDLLQANSSLSYEPLANSTPLSLLLLNTTTTSASPLDQQPQCGTRFSPDLSGAKGSAAAIDQHMIYLLLGIFSGMIMIAITIMTVFLDPLEGVLKRSSSSVASQLASVFRWFTDFRAICLVSLMVYSLLQMAFIFGEFTKVCALLIRPQPYKSLTLNVFFYVKTIISIKLYVWVGNKYCHNYVFLFTCLCSLFMISYFYIH